MTTIGLESYSSASKALLSNYRKEGVFLLCIFRVQETVNRVSLLLLAEDYACLIFFTYIENCIPQILSQLEKLVCMGSSCFKDATLRSFLKLRIQQHSPTAEVRRVSEFPFAIGSRSIVYVCAQQRAKNVSKYSNILMPSRASSYSASMLMILLRRRKGKAGQAKKLLSYMQRLLKYESPPFIPS